MKVAFFGAGEFGLLTLRALHERHQVVRVISQPDKPAGRRREPAPTAIAQLALDHGLPLQRSDNVNADDTADVLQHDGPDATVVIAFGQKLSPQVIAAGGSCVINLHASLLPKYRGAAPIQRALMKGERETGLSVIGLAQRMDAGLIYAQRKVAIDPLETASELHDRLAALGPDVVLEVLQQAELGTLAGTVQDDTLATAAPKLSREEAWVDWAQPARLVVARLHGLNPWPGVRMLWQSGNDQPRELLLRRAAATTTNQPLPEPGTVMDNGEVAARDGRVRLLEVQLPGGRWVKMEEFVRGHPWRAGDRLLRPSAA